MFQELIGSAVKISATIVVDGSGAADSASIDIYHSDGSQVVTNGTMILADGVWTYVYQSADDAKKGVYKCIINGWISYLLGYSPRCCSC